MVVNIDLPVFEVASPMPKLVDEDGRACSRSCSVCVNESEYSVGGLGRALAGVWLAVLF